MKQPRNPVIRVHLAPDEAIADNFAGGGGASSGIEWALGRSPDIAINHDAEAIAMHRANHPATKHYTESVWQVDPVEACKGRKVALAWFSPDCKHFSKAKGTTPRAQKVRGLAWSAVRWADLVKPRVIVLENVEEFATWGPLLPNGTPDPKRKGKTFRAFVRKLERLGYEVEHRLLRACDFGAPTSRRRLFLVARCDGKPIVWPEPTHGPNRSEPFRTAADCIDWSVPVPSIFDRDRPLADKTMARIARGIRKFVIQSARPFIAPVNHGGVGRDDQRVHSVDEPMRTITGHGRGSHALVVPTIVKAKTYGGGGNDARSADEPLGTITASKRGEHALAVAYLVHRSNGERPATATASGQAPRIYDIKQPLGTIMAQGQKHALVTAFLAKHYGDRPTGGFAGGSSLDAPAGTVTSKDHHSLVTAQLVRYNGERREGEVRAPQLDNPLPTQDTSNRFGMVTTHLMKLRGTSEAHLDSCSSSMDDQVPTISAGGNHLAAVQAFLVRYNGKGEPETLTEPMGTLTTKDRYGLVTVTIDGEEYAIVDIGMRMLTPRELFRAQGFAEDYDITATSTVGKPLTKTAQVRMCGNSVAPPIAAAIVRAQFAEAA